MDSRAIERKREIESAVADVRAIEREHGVTRAGLEKIKQRLTRLAARQDLFTASDFPPPQPGSKRNSCLYRVAEDADHRFALYVNSSDGNYWMSLVGMRCPAAKGIHVSTASRKTTITASRCM